MSVLENWLHWKSFLGDKVIHAQGEGMAQDKMSEVAFQIGSYLSKNVDPKNEQERVLSDLWSVADTEEQHTLANLMIRLVQNNKTH